MPLQPAPVQPRGLPVPTVKLTSDGAPGGVDLPMVAMGTGSGQKGEVATATKLWLAKAGGTAIDTAFQYLLRGNKYVIQIQQFTPDYKIYV